MTLDDDVTALLYGYLESIGVAAYRQAIEQATIEDLRRVCQKYFGKYLPLPWECRLNSCRSLP